MNRRMRGTVALFGLSVLVVPVRVDGQTNQPTEGTPESASPNPGPRGETVPPAAPSPLPPSPARVAPEAPPTDALVHIAADYPHARLEARSDVDEGPWQRTCVAPCDGRVLVDGRQFRVSAPGMTTSNVFRIDPGYGSARLKVSGGSSTARTVGLSLLIAGLPVTFGGMTLFGFGSTEDRGGLKTIGIVTLATGAAAVAASLPLLLVGSTTVRNHEGEAIAKAPRFLF